MQKLLNILLVVLLCSCGVWKKNKQEDTIVSKRDSVASHKVSATATTKITGDSMVTVPETYVEGSFAIDTTGDADSIETTTATITVTPIIKDGVVTKVKVKAKQKQQNYYPNYNYENITELTAGDSTAVTKSTARATVVVEKQKDTRINLLTYVGIGVACVGVGWLIGKLTLNKLKI